MEATRSSVLRKRILKQRGVEFEKHTRAPLTYAEAPVPYAKTNLMKLIELKFGDKLENLLSSGTIYSVGKKLGINYSTVSKWRKIISDAKFFSQF